jgi:MFS family permease
MAATTGQPRYDYVAELSRKQLTRALIAGTVGTTIEAYDFLLYTVAVPLVFAKLFFPNFDPLSAILLGFTTQFVGFAARPLGALIFGHFGDRIGRKSTLIVTLLTMGLATAAIGALPTYTSIGIWGAVALTGLRVLQGIGLGGEWAGAVLIAMEWGKTNRRGLITSVTQIGQPLGLVMANGGFLLLSALTGHDFIVWGWRVAFLFSLVMLVIGLYIRLGILETPPFTVLLERRKIERHPVLSSIARHPREIIFTILLKAAEQAPFYLFTSFVLAYGTGILKMTRNDMLTAVLVASSISLFSLPFYGWLSDKVGRKAIIRLGLVAMGAFAFPYFWMLGQRTISFVLGAVIISLMTRDILYGPVCTLIAESFTGRMRYSGASIGFNFASLIAGGPAPLIATYLLTTYKSATPIAIYIIACAVLGLIGVTFLRDRSRVDHRSEYDEAPAPSDRTSAPSRVPAT